MRLYAALVRPLMASSAGPAYTTPIAPNRRGEAVCHAPQDLAKPMGLRRVNLRLECRARDFHAASHVSPGMVKARFEGAKDVPREHGSQPQ